MKQRDFHIGPGAASLLLVAVVVSMGVLGLLALISAHNDEVLTDRSKALVAQEYTASAQAEKMLAELDAVLLSCADAADQADYLSRVEKNLPQGMTMAGGLVTWQVPAGSRTLQCALRVEPLGQTPRYRWQEHLFIPGMDEEFYE